MERKKKDDIVNNEYKKKSYVYCVDLVKMGKKERKLRTAKM